MSRPTDAARSKLSVIAHALFHLEPLPPLHHVVNVDKISKITEDRPYMGAHNNNKAKMALIELSKAGAVQTPRTTTYPSDFWPSKESHQTPYPRPPYLGILFTPKVSPVIQYDRKYSWDFVLRRLFVKEAVPVKDVMKGLGFGAENLVPKLLDTTDEYEGKPVEVEKLVRDLDQEEWIRVVDVFYKWPFRPPVSFGIPIPLTCGIECISRSTSCHRSGRTEKDITLIYHACFYPSCMI